MDWISDHHLSKIKSEESGMDGEKPLLRFASQRNDIQEKCIKVCFLVWYIWFMKITTGKPVVCFIRGKNIESLFGRKLTIPIILKRFIPDLIKINSYFYLKFLFKNRD